LIEPVCCRYGLPTELLAKTLRQLIPLTFFTIHQSLARVPWDPEEGLDFVITKSLQGSFNSYAKSRYAFKPRPLTDFERAAVEKFGLHDLDAELGTCPSAETIEIIKQMGVDSLAGVPFDADKYGPHGFRAYRVDYNGFSNGSQAAAPPSPTPNATTVAPDPHATRESVIAALRARTSARTGGAQ
jgi:hypothetical protein